MLFYVSTHGLSSLFLRLVFNSTLEVTGVASDPFPHLDLTSSSLLDSVLPVDSLSSTLVHSGSLLLSWIRLRSITGPSPVLSHASGRTGPVQYTPGPLLDHRRYTPLCFCIRLSSLLCQLCPGLLGLSFRGTERFWPRG